MTTRLRYSPIVDVSTRIQICSEDGSCHRNCLEVPAHAYSVQLSGFYPCLHSTVQNCACNLNVWSISLTYQKEVLRAYPCFAFFCSFILLYYILFFFCGFRQKSWQVIGFCHKPMDWRLPSGKYWIRHCI